jgi:anti-sigma regulatory factor (Ser/Thr protein kinase)
MDIRTDKLVLIAMPNAARLARAFTAETLREWGHDHPEFTDAAVLVVSELVANAIQALGLPRDPSRLAALPKWKALIEISLTETEGCLRIDVWDSDPRLPQPRGPVPMDSLGGRGLEIVAALAKDVGYSRDRDPRRETGKSVFAVLPLPAVEGRHGGSGGGVGSPRGTR